jgi:hypothetical protein
MPTPPRQQLLDIWQATARVSYRDDRWVPGDRKGHDRDDLADKIGFVRTAVAKRIVDESAWEGL